MLNKFDFHGRIISFGTTIIISMVVFLLITTVPIFSPFSPTVPYTSDFWVYFDSMAKPLVKADFLVGRPLALILLRVMGWMGLGEKGAMLFFSSLSFVAISSILLACESLADRPLKLHLRIFYVFLAMTLPTYFQVYQQDFGGIAATIFFCLALVVASKPTNKVDKIIIFILMWLSFEFKPTWMAGAPIAFGAIWLVHRDRKDALFLAIQTVVLAAAILLKDITLNSFFINYTETDAGYKIGSLWEIASAYTLYGKNALTTPVLVTLGFTLLVFKCSNKTIFVVLGVAAGAILPIATLTNHLIPSYSWYASPFVLGVIAASQAPRWNISASSQPAIARNLSILGYFSVLIAIMVMSVKQIGSIERNFYLDAQEIISSDLQVLKEIQGLPEGSKILVGAMHPWSPFNHWEYTSRIVGGDVQINYLVRDDFVWIVPGAPWIKAIPPEAIIRINNVKAEDFDYFVDLSTPVGGPTLVKVSDLKKDAAERYITYLYCPNLSKIRFFANNNPQKILEEAKCLVDEGKPDKALDYLHSQRKFLIGNQWGYFVEGQTYEAQGKCKDAISSYKEAVDIDPNPLFISALKKLKNEICTE